MPRDQTIIFVCEHGAAKSVIASAYFNKLAAEMGLKIQSIARGTHPEAELSPEAIEGLQSDGFMPAESVPQKLSKADVESARRIVTFCELPEEFQNKTSVEQWNSVPSVSENYARARDEIVSRIRQLLNDMSK